MSSFKTSMSVRRKRNFNYIRVNKQRIDELNLHEVMKYELSPYPPSLFESKHRLRKPDKPVTSRGYKKACYICR